MTKALIWGVTGQDGSYLAENLCKDSRITHVIGVIRRNSNSSNLCRIENLMKNKKFSLLEGDVTDLSSVIRTLNLANPDHVYNLAAQSHVGMSFHQPHYTWQVTAGGALNILEAIKNINKKIRFYQASSSEMFGQSFSEDENGRYQDENTPFQPVSPYAVAKLAAHHTTSIYRKSYGIFCVSGILFNHESPRRDVNFVTRKITRYIGTLVANCADRVTPVAFPQQKFPSFSIKWNEQKLKEFPNLRLGNIHTFRDWGHAKDYVNAMKICMFSDSYPLGNDYVVGTGIATKVETFLQKAFSIVGLDYKTKITIDSNFERPCEVPFLKCRTKRIADIGWSPTININDLIQEMVFYDISLEGVI
ncbi:MAG: GDP-mannose 4,6-dehydratase [Bacteroidales bacterium]